MKLQKAKQEYINTIYITQRHQIQQKTKKKNNKTTKLCFAKQVNDISTKKTKKQKSNKT